MSEKTKVIFRVFKTKPKSVIALFPEIPADLDRNCMSYMHIGQHSAADYFHLVAGSHAATRPATEEEYHGLMVELQRIGYDLEIYKKRTSRMYHVFMAQSDEYRKELKT